MQHDVYSPPVTKGMQGKRIRHMLTCLQLGGALALSCYAGSDAIAKPADPVRGVTCDADGIRPDRVAGIREQSISTPDGRIAYYRFGHGSPVIFITGYRATLSEWNTYFLGALSAQHEIIIYDNRGVGRSRSGSASYGVGDMAGDAARLISALGLQNVTVAGWSMGGAIAQQLALDAPARISRLVLINAMAPGSDGLGPSPDVIKVLAGDGPGHFAATMRLLFPSPAVRHAGNCFAENMFSPGDYHHVPIPASVALAQEKMMARWAENKTAYRQLGKITVPVLLLSGRDDAVLSPENSRVLYRAFPHSTLAEYPDAGHAMMYQYPQLLAARIAAFIRAGHTR